MGNSNQFAIIDEPCVASLSCHVNCELLYTIGWLHFVLSAFVLVPIKVSCFLYGAIHSRRGPLCEGFLGTNKGINRTSSQSHVEAFSLAASVSSQRTRSRGKMSIFASSHSDSDSKLCWGAIIQQFVPLLDHPLAGSCLFLDTRTLVRTRWRWWWWEEFRFL